MSKGILLLIVIGAVLLGWVVWRVLEKVGSPAHLRRIAARINRSNHSKDQGMLFVSGAEAEEKRLTIFYKFHRFRAEDLDPTSLPGVSEKMSRDACEKPTLRELLDAGVTLRFVFRDSDDKHVMTSEMPTAPPLQ